MTNQRIVRVLVMTACALCFVLLATPARAQQGSLRGKVVDEAGKPVPDADVTLDFVGDYTRQYTAKSDKNGEWVKAGLPPGGGTWTITAVKGNLKGVIKGVSVRIGEMWRTEDIVVRAGGKGASGAPGNMSAADIEKANKKQKELEQEFNDAKTAIDAGNYDDALAKLNAIITDVPKCAGCYARMGDVYVKKSDLPKAEESYLKAIEIDPNTADAYAALASVYNSEKKFDDAAKMSAKANELQGASATGNNPEAVYNQGIIFWNQGKIAEAKAQFEKVIQLDPKMADAQYWYGMALVNEGKLPDAKKPFEEYLKLAPTGQYADTAKAMLAMIK